MGLIHQWGLAGINARTTALHLSNDVTDGARGIGLNLKGGYRDMHRQQRKGSNSGVLLK